jgi:hypothetical protein
MRITIGRHTLLTGTTTRVASDVGGQLQQVLLDALRQVLGNVSSFTLIHERDNDACINSEELRDDSYYT